MPSWEQKHLKQPSWVSETCVLKCFGAKKGAEVLLWEPICAHDSALLETYTNSHIQRMHYDALSFHSSQSWHSHNLRRGPSPCHQLLLTVVLLQCFVLIAHASKTYQYLQDQIVPNSKADMNYKESI